MAFWDKDDEVTENETGFVPEDDNTSLSSAPASYVDDFNERIEDDEDMVPDEADTAVEDDSSDDTIDQPGLYEQMPATSEEPATASESEDMASDSLAADDMATLNEDDDDTL